MTSSKDLAWWTRRLNTNKSGTDEYPSAGHNSRLNKSLTWDLDVESPWFAKKLSVPGRLGRMANRQAWLLGCVVTTSTNHVQQLNLPVLDTCSIIDM